MILLVAVLTLFTGISAVAASITYRERLTAMNDQEINTMIKSVNSKIGAIYFNRLLSESESEGISETLLAKYESEGLFPVGDIMIVNERSEVEDNTFLFFEIKSNTFFLPARELTEEEMLQIIDFYHKVDYALFVTQDNEEIEEVSDDALEPVIDMLEYEDINNYIQIKRMNLNFDGVINKIAGNAECLYISSKESIFRYSHDNLDECTEVFSCDEGNIIFSIATDSKNNLYVSLRNQDAINNKLIRISEEGDVTEYCLNNSEQTIDISQKLPYTMYADIYGRLYVNCRVDDSNVIFYVFSRSGELEKSINDSDYMVHESNGLCIGNEGYIYKVAQNELIKIDPMLYKSIDSIDYMGVNMLPQVDYISQMPDESFVMFSKGGIISYTWGNDCYEYLLQPYEIEDVFVEGMKSAQIDDKTFATVTRNGVLTYIRHK